MKKNDLREKIHLTSVDELFGLENAESSIEIEIDNSPMKNVLTWCMIEKLKHSFNDKERKLD